MSKEFKEGDRVQYNPIKRSARTGFVLSEGIDRMGKDKIWVEFDDGEAPLPFYKDGKFIEMDTKQTLFHEGDPHPDNKMCRCVLLARISGWAMTFYTIPVLLKEQFILDRDNEDMTNRTFGSRYGKYIYDMETSKIFIQLD